MAGYKKQTALPKLKQALGVRKYQAGQEKKLSEFRQKLDRKREAISRARLKDTDVDVEILSAWSGKPVRRG